MPVRWILVAEDDHFQREAIAQAIKDAAPRGFEIEIILANSEIAANDALDSAERSGITFDAYVIDLHLPWSQEDSFPQPPFNVVQYGPLQAGLRVADRISNSRNGRNSSLNIPQKPIILYTIDDGPDILAFGDGAKNRHGLLKGDDDSELADLILSLIC